jgi:acyl-coenzyme A thioesterase PaaI-like protein
MFRKLMNLWPPFLGAGIKVKNIDPDFTTIDVELKQRFYNKNYVGTHYGGSLFSMTDPFYMLILMKQLGKDYIVWDKSAKIDFKKPGKGKLTAHFNITQKQVKDIKDQADKQKKVEPKFTVQVLDEKGDVVAEIEKTLHVRRKSPKP